MRNGEHNSELQFFEISVTNFLRANVYNFREHFEKTATSDPLYQPDSGKIYGVEGPEKIFIKFVKSGSLAGKSIQIITDTLAANLQPTDIVYTVVNKIRSLPLQNLPSIELLEDSEFESGEEALLVEFLREEKLLNYSLGNKNTLYAPVDKDGVSTVRLHTSRANSNPLKAVSASCMNLDTGQRIMKRDLSH